MIKLICRSQLINLAIFAFGLQFVSSLQIANMSSMYKFFGAPSYALPFLGLSAPIAGLIIQPLIGQMSDNTNSPYGKRRPYIFAWGIIATIACFSLIFSRTLWLTAIDSFLLSCSINGCIEALRALTGDIIPNTQKTNAFSLQTICSGIGAGCSAIIPYFIYNHIHIDRDQYTFDHIPLSLKISFLLAGIILICCLIWLLYSVKEKKARHAQLRKTISKRMNLTAKFYHLFYHIYFNIRHMPLVIEEFMIIQIFTWMGLFAFWLYFSIGISQHIYGLPNSTNAHFATILENGLSHAGIYFSVYQGISVIYAMLLPLLTKNVSPKMVHGLSLIAGAIGMISSGLVINHYLLMLSMIGIGIMWGSIMTLPYAIISAEIPTSKMGIYLGIFNISITLPQIIAGLIYEPIYSILFSKQAIQMVIFGGVLILIGGVVAVYRSLPLPSRLNHALKVKCLN